MRIYLFFVHLSRTQNGPEQCSGPFVFIANLLLRCLRRSLGISLRRFGLLGQLGEAGWVFHGDVG